MTQTRKPTPISQPHCQQCGSTDYEDVNTHDDPDLQGYSACCNEIVIWGGACREGVCYHGDWDTAVYCDECGLEQVEGGGTGHLHFCSKAAR